MEGMALCFYHVGSGDQRQEVWLKEKCCYLLSHLAGPFFSPFMPILSFYFLS